MTQAFNPPSDLRYNGHMATQIPGESWRIIRHPVGEGPWNMAVDEAILRSVSKGEALPTLRFYGWSPACLSLGRAQQASEIDRKRLSTRNWGVVRRPTGGRAILHQEELTYAVVAPEVHPLMRGGVLESYRRISSALVHGLESLDLKVKIQGSDAESEDGRGNPICFEVPSAYEITILDRKILGSAQVRKRRTVLQHGSLPLSGDIGLICEVLHYPTEDIRQVAMREVRRRAATLEDISGQRLHWGGVADALASGFQQALNLNFIESDLSPEEVTLVMELLESRYANPAWTFADVGSEARSSG